MRKATLLSALTLAIAVSAFADVTIKQTTSGKGLGMTAGAAGTTYIKGMRMRSDVDMRGNTMTTIFDLENQKMYVFDSKKKSADVWDMQAFSEELAKSVDPKSIKASMKANGKTKEIAGKTANGYDVKISVPTAMGGEEGMEMMVTMQGPIWIVKDAPGSKDYANFYKAAVEKGWIFSDPRAAKGQPGQAKAMAEMHRQLAAAGGIAYESEMAITMSGEGPMAAMLARMGNVTMTNTVTAVETGALDDALFAPPAGYKLVQKK